MSNIDSFLNDKSTPATKSSGTDQIDSFLSDAPVQGRGALGFARDAGVALAKGIIGVPEAGVGIADLVTGGQAGKLAESAGIRFKDAKDALSELYTPQQQAANKEVNDAKGFFPTVGAMLRNPSTIADQAIESAPTMITGGLAARGLMAAVPRISPILAGAFGEGATAAGQNAEQVRQEDPNGTLSPTQAGILAASGALTGGIGFGAGKLANKLGIGDINTMLASGKLGAVGDDAIATGASKGFLRKAGEGAAVEGVLQELPQSYQEQVAQNIAQGKPWDQGAAEAGAQGMLAGGLMGVAGGPLHGGHDTAYVDANNQVQPAAESQQAQPVLALPAPTYTVDSDGNVMNTADQNAAVQNNQGGGNIIDVTPVPQSPEPQAQPTLALPAPTYSVGSDGTVRTTADDNADIQMQRQADQDRIERIARGEINDITPTPQAPKLSEQMGIDPNAGSMSSAAAIAVDSGASQHLANLQAEQQAADEAKKQAKKGAQGSQSSPAGDLTSAAKLLSPSTTSSVQSTIDQLPNLSQANSLKESFIDNFNNAPDQSTKNKLFTDATASGVKSSDVASWVAEAKQRATDSQSQAQPIPEQQAAPTYVKEGIQQAQANAKAKQVNTQQATTDSTSVAPTSQIDPATQWSSMTPAQRMVVSATTDIKPVIARNMSKVSWDKLNPDVQQKLASSMQSQANQDTSFTPPKDVNDLASQWVDAHNADDKVKKQQLLNYGNQNFDQATMTNAVNDAMAKNAQSTAKVAPTVKQQLTVETNKEDQIKDGDILSIKNEPFTSKGAAQITLENKELRNTHKVAQLGDKNEFVVRPMNPAELEATKQRNAEKKQVLEADGYNQVEGYPNKFSKYEIVEKDNRDGKTYEVRHRLAYLDRDDQYDHVYASAPSLKDAELIKATQEAERDGKPTPAGIHRSTVFDGKNQEGLSLKSAEIEAKKRNHNVSENEQWVVEPWRNDRNVLIDGKYQIVLKRTVTESPTNKENLSVGDDNSHATIKSESGVTHSIPSNLIDQTHKLSHVVPELASMHSDTQDREGQQEHTQKLLSDITSKNPDLNVRVVHDLKQVDKPAIRSGLKSGGYYDPETNTAFIYPKAGEWEGNAHNLLNHEIVHAVTAHALRDGNVPKETLDGLDAIRAKIKQYVYDNHEHFSSHLLDRLNRAADTTDELLSVGLGEHDANTALKDILSKDDFGKLNSSFEQISNQQSGNNSNEKQSGSPGINQTEDTKRVSGTESGRSAETKTPSRSDQGSADNTRTDANREADHGRNEGEQQVTKNTPAQSIRDGIAKFEKAYQVDISAADVSTIVKSLSSKRMLKPIDGTHTLYELLTRTSVEFNARNLINGEHVVDVLTKYDLAKSKEHDGWRFELTNKGVDFFYHISRALSNNGHLDDKNSEQSNQSIQDFGEKIGGAKKDLWKDYKKSLSDELPTDAKDITLSKHFPEPDYEQLLKDGVPESSLAAIKAMRDEIPAKPRMAYKVSRWAEQVKAVREFASEILDGKISSDELKAKMRDSGRLLNELADKVQLYEDVGYPNFIKMNGVKVESGRYTIFNGKEYPAGVVKYSVDMPNKRTAYFDHYEDAVAHVKDAIVQKADEPPTAKNTSLDIWKVRRTGDIVIGKKVAAGKYLDLKTGFKSWDEARKYLAEHQDELLSDLKKRKLDPTIRKESNNPRIGEDYRQGEAVTPEKFDNAFGFRGVEFGNYVEGAKRQEDLNNAYDGLLDLAKLLNIPPKAISLNGELGMAFGARGQGGKDAAKAHYERGAVVINLTKNNGAGSLAHEWLHALDNYFSRIRGKKDDMISSRPNPLRVINDKNQLVNDTSVRPEILDAWNGVLKAIKASGMLKRSTELDKAKSKNYWSTDHELIARAFEKYVIDRANERGESSDYLANIISEDAFNQRNDGKEQYPYPTNNEAVEINKAFQNLFDTLKTKETDKGIALFSRKAKTTSESSEVAQVRKQLVDRFGTDTIRKLEQDGKLEIVPTHTDSDVEGFYQNGKVTLVAGNLSPSEVIPTMLHELGGHAGMQGLMRPEAYQSIVDSFNKLVAAGNPVALRAKARATIAEKNQATRDLEYIPYLITESVNAQDSNVQQRLAITHFIKRVIAAVRAFAFDKLGIPLNLTPDDMVALAERMVNQVADSKISQSGSNLTVSNQPLYSRAGIRDIAGMATTELNKRFSAPGKLSAWHKTVGTMYNLAERSSSFKPVFNAAQNFIDDVSFYASEAAELAPQLLPKLENWKDIAKSPISAEDNNAVAKPIFEGTLLWGRDRDGTPVLVDTLAEAASKLSTERKAQILEATGNLPAGIHKAWKALPAEKYAKMIDSRYETTFLKPGVVWTDDELKSHFNLNDAQIALYHEFRDSANQSLDSMTKAEMLRIGSKDVKDMRDQVMSAKSVTEASHMLMERLSDIALTEPDRATSLMQAAQDIKNRAESTVDLQAAGYAPLSRFGKYSVDVVQDGERQYFGLFETAYEANKMAEKMRAEFGKDNVTQGTLSAEAYKLFAGITPESLELFGNMLGLNSDGDKAQDQAFQEYIRLTKNNRSAMKRLIHRKGIAGYSEDVGRVLASFIYSNSRQTAGGLHMGDLDEAVQDIPKGEGELTDVAVKLRDYIKNPQEEAQAVRGLLFAQFLGGSIASALVNMTQPIAVTFPYLSQYGGAVKAAAQLTKAAKQIASKRNQFEPDLAAALKRAEEDGTVSPQEVHQLMAQARGKGSLTSGDGTRVGDVRALAQNTMSRFSLAWGKLFGAAEQLNRQVTFIAAYRMAKDQGMASPDEFARHVVKETQFVYSKASKMQWGRGAIGGTLMTFKTFNIAYLELMNRLWNKGEAGSDERKQGRKAALIMLATMMVLSGAGGLPFTDDLNDLIDGLAQIAGYNFSTKKAKQEFLEDTFGKPAADFIDRGITGLPGMPLDVAGRLGMSNLIPGTGLLKQSNNHTNDVMEIAGPAGKLASNILSGANSIANGDIKSGLLQMAPQSVQNAAKGADMATTGMYRDSKGYKVLETNELEAALKAIGFQPSSVSDIQEANGLNQSAKAFYNMKKQDISSMWAQGIFEQDSDMVQKARDQISDWNNKNPDQPMVINIASVLRKAREMNKSKDERIAATAPKAMRAQMKQEIEQRRLEYSN